ncbi:hypothetical protein T265_02357 [Opisthorchis viverrini]|uniref:Uncharacterized protein n=1 Tax=Opisthorchis viverrini TaxID=6198 RepID=A0A075AID6_OPIVI|nr:hypothetical protein T265_02357 [Opisthorchis viverrini]KER31449.1 hypothetical protein T265_02357 [Opisthorchis viverrini]
MEHGKALLRERFSLRGRMTPPKVFTKVANSARSRAAELIQNVRTHLESPTYVRRSRMLNRRAKSVDRSDFNVSNADPSVCETSSLQTTSTSSSANSGFLGFSLPTTLNPADPLPAPTCRLGAYQAEWLVDNEGAWKLITEDATAAPVDQATSTGDSVPQLLRVNKALKKEQKFLKAKLSILLDELAKQTAVVHYHEKKLDKLREELKKKSKETNETIRSEMRRELEQKLETTRLERNLRSTLLSTEDEEESASNTAEDTAASDSITNSNKSDQTKDDALCLSSPCEKQKSAKRLVDCPPKQRKVPASKLKTAGDNDTTTEMETETEETFESKHPKTEPQFHKKGARNFEELSSKHLEDNEESDTLEDASSNRSFNATESKASPTTSTVVASDESANEATKKSDTTSPEDSEEEQEDEQSEGDDEEEEDEDLDDEEFEDEEVEEEHEELSKTDESQTEHNPSARRRVVQFGTVSRR